MNEFERFCAMLKIAYENFVVLHHQIVGDSWREAHEWMADLYEAVQECADDMTEIGIGLGYREATIADAVLAFQGDIITSEPRRRTETYEIARGILRTLSGMAEAAKAVVPTDVQNKLDEYAYEFDKQANYKLERALIGFDLTT